MSGWEILIVVAIVYYIGINKNLNEEEEKGKRYSGIIRG